MNERIFSESIKKFPFTQKKLFRPAVFSQGIVTTSHSAPHDIWPYHARKIVGSDFVKNF